MFRKKQLEQRWNLHPRLNAATNIQDTMVKIRKITGHF